MRRTENTAGKQVTPGFDLLCCHDDNVAAVSKDTSEKEPVCVTYAGLHDTPAEIHVDVMVIQSFSPNKQTTRIRCKSDQTCTKLE